MPVARTSTPRARWIRGASALLLVSALGCAREPPGRPDAGRPVPDDASEPVTPISDGGAPVDRDGAALYALHCASCHGARGEGRPPVPAVDRWTRGEVELTAVIDARMPPANPAACDAACAARIAAFVLAELQRPPDVACDPARRPPRALRLLNRREFAASAAVLFADCRLRTFSYGVPAGSTPPRSVAVSGTFNGWAPTVAAGAWPLTADGARWSMSRAVPDGRHEYKLVIDETTWVADPSNPRTAPDGFGGNNSVLDVDCAGEVDPWTLTARFPPETRPPGFPFDGHAGANTIGIVRLDEQWAAAQSFAVQRAARVASEAGCLADRARCADRLLELTARRAFRRPLEVAERAAQRAQLLEGTDAVAAVQRWIRALLASPHFLYRSELGELDSATGRFRLTGFERATALAFGLWGTPPDDALLDAAAAGALDTREGMQAVARRMLADPRGRAPLETFATQWLGLERVLTADKRTDAFPAYDLALRGALVAETARLFSHVVLDGTHTLEELLTADYTFADAAIARLYELPPPSGAGLARTSLAGTRRRGVLGHGSVLGAYAYSDQSSPVRRGVFVRERLLCQHLGVPPPNAGGIPEVDPTATTRERFQQHASDPSCAACHRAIDPIGFGFERFDALGRERDSEAGRPIDDRGDLVDLERLGAGTHAPFASIAELGALLANSEAAHACVAEQYLQFARGAEVAEGEGCTLDDVVARYADTRDLRDLIVAVYTAPAFLERE